VPGGSVADALGAVTGIGSTTVIDAASLVGATPPDGFASGSGYLKWRTAGPTAQSFSINFAALYRRPGGARARPGSLWCGDEAARGGRAALRGRRVRPGPGLRQEPGERSAGECRHAGLRDHPGRDGAVPVPDGPAGRALTPQTARGSGGGRPGGQAPASRPIAPDLAYAVTAWRWRERAAGTSAAATGWSAGCADEGRPGPGGTGKPPDPGSGARVGICVRDLKFWIHPAFPVLF